MSVLSAESVRAALTQMRPRPSVEMYPGDWLRDPISGCSLAANGFWWRATITMHDAKPYGHMVGNNGRPLTDQQIAQKCGARSLGEMKKVLREIEDAGIPGRTGDTDYADIFVAPEIDIRGTKWTLDLSPLAIQESGVIYSRRMVRDRILSLVRFLVTPRGQSIFPSLQEGLHTQIAEFDRMRARDAQEDEDRSSSARESSEELGEGCGERKVGPQPVNPASQPNFESLEPLVHKLQSAAFSYPPSDQICFAWIQEFGADLVLETLVDCEPQYSGKNYRYFEAILNGRRNNPNERPGNRRKQQPGRDAGHDQPERKRKIVNFA